MPSPQYDYERVAGDLREQIRAGRLKSGDKLPSRVQLCEIYDVSRMVVDRAMFILKSEGLTETLPGVGVYVK